jgi:hypothetical protein
MGNSTYSRQLQHSPYCSNVEQWLFHNTTAIKISGDNNKEFVMDEFKKRRIFCFCRDSNPDGPARSLVTKRLRYPGSWTLIWNIPTCKYWSLPQNPVSTVGYLLACQMSFLSQAYWTTLKTGAKPLPKTSTNVCQNKWRRNPAHFTMNQ